jgi:hypothetical protein
VFWPLHTVWLAIGSITTVGVGKTVNAAALEKLAGHPPFENFALNKYPSCPAVGVNV